MHAERRALAVLVLAVMLSLGLLVLALDTFGAPACSSKSAIEPMGSSASELDMTGIFLSWSKGLPIVLAELNHEVDLAVVRGDPTNRARRQSAFEIENATACDDSPDCKRSLAVHAHVDLVGAAESRELSTSRAQEVSSRALETTPLGDELEHRHVVALEVEVDAEAAATVPGPCPELCAILKLTPAFDRKQLADLVPHLANRTLRHLLVDEDRCRTSALRASLHGNARRSVL